MANLTVDKFLEGLNPAKTTKRSAPAAVATYFVGQVVMAGGDDNIVKPISASVVAGTQVVGYVNKQQVIATLADELEFIQAPMALSGSGFTDADFNKLVFMDDSDAAYEAKGTNRLYGGRVVQVGLNGSSAANTIMVDVGNVPSGSAV